MSIGFASALRAGRHPSVTAGPLRGAGASAPTNFLLMPDGSRFLYPDSSRLLLTS